MAKIKVFIDGSAGTTGLKIYDRLSARQDVELIEIDEKLRKDINCRKEAIESADAAFLCLPDSAAREIAAVVENSRVKILDTSTTHRTNPAWAYGFPELSDKFRKKIENSSRIAVPGCHASGFCSIVKPLVDYGIIPADYPVVCTSVTGYSGGGKKMISEYEGNEKTPEMDSPRQYGLTQCHKHLPEMKKICGLQYEPCFSPIVADYYSGMTVTVPITARLMSKKLSAKDIYEIFKEHYAGQKLVQVAPYGADGFLGSNNLSGKDSMEIIVTGNDDRILIASRFDNLGKGASGAAVQCFNIITGNTETEGLVL